uniref:EGF-like domain-containing protein n=1 Tax=Pyramimonas obovata TaxID=1411642 RepID=A0A7S0RNA7_9CHLO|mmetsp:Transcript_38818/g.84485  ORF Transcript_38818/g.84485 Transcript_38818/m.84485 type:complete len:206 (+) Transcript_38818:119-736(+)
MTRLLLAVALLLGTATLGQAAKCAQYGIHSTADCARHCGSTPFSAAVSDGVAACSCGSFQCGNDDEPTKDHNCADYGIKTQHDCGLYCRGAYSVATSGDKISCACSDTHWKCSGKMGHDPKPAPKPANPSCKDLGIKDSSDCSKKCGGAFSYSSSSGKQACSCSSGGFSCTTPAQESSGSSFWPFGKGWPFDFDFSSWKLPRLMK